MTPNKFYFHESHPHPFAVETTSMIYLQIELRAEHALFPRFSGKRYPGYQRFLLACDEELRRAQVK